MITIINTQASYLLRPLVQGEYLMGERGGEDQQLVKEKGEKKKRYQNIKNKRKGRNSSTKDKQRRSRLSHTQALEHTHLHDLASLLATYLLVLWPWTGYFILFALLQNICANPCLPSTSLWEFSGILCKTLKPIPATKSLLNMWESSILL